MSERELVRELKETIKDLSNDRDTAIAAVQAKESRIKQVLIKLEHATSDVSSMGHKIGEQNKEITNLQLKLETKDRLLTEALEKIRELKNGPEEEEDTVENTESESESESDTDNEQD